jgi:hypothetical protein
MSVSQKPGPELGAGNEDGVDSCACSITISQADITPDSELPAAAGGVESAGEQLGAEHLDGCDLDFHGGTPTKDEDLPAAFGGVS